MQTEQRATAYSNRLQLNYR